MKTYKEFMSEAAPLLAAPLIMKGIGAGLAATGLTGMVMQATKRQGEGRRSQPVDYGQGDTATPGPGVSTRRKHRKDTNAQRQSDQAREDRRAEARRRAKERKEAEQRDVEQKIDDLIGSEADRRYAKQKRKERGIDEQITRLVNVKTVGGITRGVDASTGEIKIIKGRTKREQEAVKNPPGFEMY